MILFFGYSRSESIALQRCQRSVNVGIFNPYSSCNYPPAKFWRQTAILQNKPTIVFTTRVLPPCSMIRLSKVFLHNNKIVICLVFQQLYANLSGLPQYIMGYPVQFLDLPLTNVPLKNFTYFFLKNLLSKNFLYFFKRSPQFSGHGNRKKVFLFQETQFSYTS